MTLDAQIGDQYDSSTTNIHIIELHGATAAWIFGFFLILGGVVAAMWWWCRRRYRQKQLRQGRQLALTFEGCTCGAAAGAAADGQRNLQRSNRGSRLARDPIEVT
jgi:hypothetical protein